MLWMYGWLAHAVALQRQMFIDLLTLNCYFYYKDLEEQLFGNKQENKNLNAVLITSKTLKRRKKRRLF